MRDEFGVTDTYLTIKSLIFIDARLAGVDDIWSYLKQVDCIYSITLATVVELCYTE